MRVDRQVIKVPLTPTPPPKKNFPLIQSTSFPDYFSENIISVDRCEAAQS